MEITDGSSSFVIEIKLDEETNKENKKSFFKIIRNETEINLVKKYSKEFRKSKFSKTTNKKSNGRISCLKSEKKIHNKQEGIFNVGRWSDDEHKKFMEALLKYGNNWNKVQEFIGTRNSTQARSHAQKFFVKIGRTKIQKLDLDFQNNSLHSLSLLINNLEEEQIATSLKNLNEKILVIRKDKKYANEMNHASTESDSVNLMNKERRNTFTSSKNIESQNIRKDEPKHFCNEENFLSCNSILVMDNILNTNRYKISENLPDLFSYSDRIEEKERNNLTLNYQINCMNQLNEENFLNSINDNTVFNNIQVDPNPFFDEKYIEMFFDNKNKSLIDQEKQYKFEINDENHLNVNSKSFERISFVENEKFNCDSFFLNI